MASRPSQSAPNVITHLPPAATVGREPAMPIRAPRTEPHKEIARSVVDVP